MIRYALICSNEHEFDGWFRSSTDFEAQTGKGLLSCAVCGSIKVDRALMAPNVLTARSRGLVVETDDAASTSTGASAAPALVPEPSPKLPIALPDSNQKAIMEALSELKRRITATAENVGNKFAEEARKIHYGEAEERGIYGQATSEEAQALLDEGIDVHALPILPDERN